jgi:hypothetical protein
MTKLHADIKEVQGHCQMQLKPVPFWQKASAFNLRFQASAMVQMGPTGCPEMSENNYQHKLRTNSQERRPHACYEIFKLENCNGRNDRRT